MSSACARMICEFNVCIPGVPLVMWVKYMWMSMSKATGSGFGVAQQSEFDEVILHLKRIEVFTRVNQTATQTHQRKYFCRLDLLNQLVVGCVGQNPNQQRNREQALQSHHMITDWNGGESLAW